MKTDVATMISQSTRGRSRSSASDGPDDEIRRSADEQQGEGLEAGRLPLARDRRNHRGHDPCRAWQEQRRADVQTTAQRDDPTGEDDAEYEDLVEDPRLGRSEEIRRPAEERQVDEEECDDEPDDRVAGSHGPILVGGRGRTPATSGGRVGAVVRPGRGSDGRLARDG